MTTLVVTEDVSTALAAAAAEGVEKAAVVLARVNRIPGADTRVLIRELHWVPQSAYAKQLEDELVIVPEGYVDFLSAAARTGDVAIFVHTHPGSAAMPLPSKRDKVVDEKLSETFRIRTGNDGYGSIIVSVIDGVLAVTGRITIGEEDLSVDRILVVGNRLSLHYAYGRQHDPLPEHFDRNVRAFGGDMQRVLGDLRIGIVGCGGTGSAVAEQLVRLGIQNVLLIDPDKLSASNVTRVYGSTMQDVDQYKVDVLASHLKRIARHMTIDKRAGSIKSEAVARELASCDVVFGCTDDNAGRLVLSRLPTYLLTPVIDVGVLLSSDKGGSLQGIDGRITVLSPRGACLLCRGRVDAAQAGAEFMTPGERKRRADEGYAPGLGDVEPAVVAYTTAVAALAVNELLERFIHYGEDEVPGEVLLRLHDRAISTNHSRPNAGHYCDPDSGKLGLGITNKFLELQWAL